MDKFENAKEIVTLDAELNICMHRERELYSYGACSKMRQTKRCDQDLKSESASRPVKIPEAAGNLKINFLHLRGEENFIILFISQCKKKMEKNFFTPTALLDSLDIGCYGDLTDERSEIESAV